MFCELFLRAFGKESLGMDRIQQEDNNGWMINQIYHSPLYCIILYITMGSPELLLQAEINKRHWWVRSTQ